jgi:chromosome segregation ATPase
MAEQAIFKSQTFGGFNKEEVLKYIDKMNTEYSEEHDKAEAEIARLGAENEEKSAKLSETEERFDELQKKYDEIMEAYEELRQHYLMLKEHSDNIDAENEKLSARLDATAKELEIEKELNSQLEDRIEEDKQKALEHAAKERKFALAIDDAKDSTKLMLASAKTGAQTILSDAQNTADNLNGEIDEFRAEIEKTKEFMQDSLSVLIQRLEYIGKNAENAKIPSEERTSKSAEIQRKYEDLVSETEMKSAALKERFFR